jgi:hypothetical protein
MKTDKEGDFKGKIFFTYLKNVFKNSLTEFAQFLKQLVVERFSSAIGAALRLANLPTLRSKLHLLVGIHYTALLSLNS